MEKMLLHTQNKTKNQEPFFRKVLLIQTHKGFFSGETLLIIEKHIAKPD